MMPGNSISTKSLYRELTIALVVLVSIVSIAVSLLNYFYSSRESDRLLDSKIASYTANLRESLEWPLWNLDDELIVKIAGAFATNAEIASLAILDDQQQVVYHRENMEENQIRREFSVDHNGQRIGSVRIGLSLDSYANKNRWLMYTGFFTALLMIISLLGAMRWILARQLKRPVEALVAVTREIVACNYPRIDFNLTYAEFAPILNGFQIMSDAVASRENSLQQTNAQLAEEIVERRQSEASLRMNEERLKLAARAGCIGIWDWDIAANVLTWDDNMYTLYGISQEKFGGAYDVWLNLLHPDDRTRYDEAVGAALRGQREYEPEFRIVRPDGSIRKIKAYATIFRDAEGNPVRMVGTNLDITELKRIEDELRKYKDHLEEEVQLRTTDLVLARNAAETANRAKSVFLANMSHELRTPLNAILGFSNLMRSAESLSPEQRENLDIINRSGEYLLTLINDVLEMSRIEAGRVQLENAPLDLGMLVRDVTEMMQLRANEKGLQLLVDQSSEFPRYIMGDEARLRQILINLLGNAVKFTSQGSVTVRFGLKPHEVRLLIEVEDTGPGIRLEDQQRIFEPFVQVAEVSTQKGTGLGLTITRQFVQLMGGTISLESSPDKGALFRVELPVQMIPAVLKPKSIVKGEIVGRLPGQPEYRILIVEDQQENQLLLSQLMKRIGLPVETADNGACAIELFKSWHPDLIWMDRQMPVMDGIEATRHIRALPGGADVKIVAVTASAFMEQRDEMLGAGMDDFVRKPYRFNEIYEVLSKHLGVQYILEDEPQEEDSAEILTPEMLSILPSELKGELRTALESLEVERIFAAIHQVDAYDHELNKLLSNLAQNFDYPSILNALRLNGL